jgi:alpha-beta hydrolase superfamily lysophospholipase
MTNGAHQGRRFGDGVKASLAATALCVLLMPTTGRAAGDVVTFQSAGGRTVTGLLTESNRRPAPAVVLVPMLGRPKEDWQVVADRLAAAGIHSLSIDLPALFLPPDSRELTSWSDDVRAAVGFLARRTDVGQGRIGLAGASLGANLVALAAAAEAEVPSIALLSPSLDYRGVRIDRAMQQFGVRHALLVASVHDPYAARSVRTLQEGGSGLWQVRWSNVVAHGTALLSQDPEVVRALVEWFQQTLG